MHRVAVTGLGVIAPVGDSVRTLFSHLAAGQSAVAPLALPGAEEEEEEEAPPPKAVKAANKKEASKRKRKDDSDDDE